MENNERNLREDLELELSLVAEKIEALNRFLYLQQSPQTDINETHKDILTSLLTHYVEEARLLRACIQCEMLF